MAKIDKNDLEYLSFAGGGGKGVVYLGVVQGLEIVFEEDNRRAIEATFLETEKAGGLSPLTGNGFRTENRKKTDKTPIPLFPVWNSHPKHRKLKGIVGSSAGAINAFFLAMGLNSKEMETELNTVTTGKIASTEQHISKFEEFFSHPVNGQYRIFKKKEDNISVDIPDAEMQAVSNLVGNILADEELAKLAAKATGVTLGVVGAMTPATSLGLGGILAAIQARIKVLLLSNYFSEETIERKILLSDVKYTFYPEMKESEFWAKAGSPEGIRGLEALKKAEPYFEKSGSEKNPKSALHVLSGYLYNLLVDRGLFDGVQARDYFASLIKKYIIDRVNEYQYLSWTPGSIKITGDYRIPSEYRLKPPPYNPDPLQFTFRDFYNITGVDLVVTGVNIVQNVPLYFSVFHTPDFPVADAISISMSIPGIFKPYFIAKEVNTFGGKTVNDYENLKYIGLIVDGGMLNNYPIHAFDNVGMPPEYVFYQGNPSSLPISLDVKYSPVGEEYREVAKKMVGFRLVSQSLDKSEIQSEQDVYYRLSHLTYDAAIRASGMKKIVVKKNGRKKLPINLLDLIQHLYSTFAYTMEDIHIRTRFEEERTVLVDYGEISLTDFSSPELDKIRGREELANYKIQLIDKAKQRIKNVFSHQ